MALKITSTGYNVTVFVPNRTYNNAKRDADEIAKAIIKHVGCDHTEAEQPDVTEVENRVCQFCGSEWTEEEDDYNGGCCAKDQAAEDQRLADEATEEARKKAPTAGQIIYENRDGAPPPPSPPQEDH